MLKEILNNNELISMSVFYGNEVLNVILISIFKEPFATVARVDR